MLSQLDISKADLINGWMTETELRWLAEQAAVHNLIVELGSFCGRSTRALADNTHGKVIAVDDWNGVRDLQVEPQDWYGIFRENLKDHIESGKVIPWRIDHRVVRPTMEPDMVFIDGNHDYQDVCDDIKTWLPAIKRGGLICGHDMDWFGVKMAVNQLLPEWKLVFGTTIWYAHIC